jgi:hypothetical protein
MFFCFWWFFCLLPCYCPGVCSCYSAFFPACCNILCCSLTRPFLLMSSNRPPSVTMVLFGVYTDVFLLGGRFIVMGVWFLVAVTGVYLTVGGVFVCGWERLSVLSDGVLVKQV